MHHNCSQFFWKKICFVEPAIFCFEKSLSPPLFILFLDGKSTFVDFVMESPIFFWLFFFLIYFLAARLKFSMCSFLVFFDACDSITYTHTLNLAFPQFEFSLISLLFHHVASQNTAHFFFLKKFKKLQAEKWEKLFTFK